MAPQSKTQFLTDVHTHLKKAYKPKPDKGLTRLTVLEAVVYGVCHESTSREHANQALSRFKDGFFDWNEVRVSTVEEIQGVLAGIPDTEARHEIRRFLRQLFEKTYGFTLEALTKKPLKESLKALGDHEAFQSDFVEATVTRLSLGGHAIPVDAHVRRVMERLGVVDPGSDPVALRALLERSIPKKPRGRVPRCRRGILAPRHLYRTGTGLSPLRTPQNLSDPQTRKDEAAHAAKHPTPQARVPSKEKPKPLEEKAKEPPKPDKEKEKAKAAKSPSAPVPPPASRQGKGKTEGASQAGGDGQTRVQAGNSSAPLQVFQADQGTPRSEVSARTVPLPRPSSKPESVSASLANRFRRR